MLSSSSWCLSSTSLPLTSSCNGNEHHFSKHAPKYWDNFYKLHQNKFFKDRHYLVKDWGRYFSNDEDVDDRKVVLEVGCGPGNTIYPLLDAFPNMYVHACDFSPQAISLVKGHPNFNASQMNVFVCDVATDDLSISISPSSVDVITLIFTLSAFSPNKMSLVLQNLRKVLKPNGFVLFRDYAIGDSAQVKLQKKNQLISENFFFRGDGTCSFFFSEDFLSTLFSAGGFDIMDVSTYYREIENRSKNITMQRYWIRGIFRAN
ncbi:methyltransferase [Lithospermum erythrorhizon]|uniref:tRNA N(3)-methylcytidine methyltransferase n=1 Tax=Lithospermum erythrorhizon TaxID=34254 RepID=A0AAV3R6I1_LITER